MRCPSCDAFLNQHARFCHQCGRPAALTTALNAKAERRSITVLYGRMEGLIHHRKGIAAHALHVLHAQWNSLIEQYGGYTADSKPDDICIYFGYPNAHGDEALRALSLANDMYGALQKWQQAKHTPHATDELKAFWAVHSGLMIVGGELRRGGWSQLAVEDPPYVAANLTQLMTKQGITVSDTTRRLLPQNHPVSHWHHRGVVEVRGMDDPISVWEISSDMDTGINNAPTAAPAMTGRSHAFTMLKNQCAQAIAYPNRGTLCLVTAAEGMGKSLLMTHLMQHVREQGGHIHTLQCASYHTVSDGFPLQSWLESQVGISSQDSVTTRQRKLQEGFPRMKSEDLALLMQRLSLPLPHQFVIPPLSQAAVKTRTDAILIQLLTAHTEASDTVTLIIVEDVHWADPSTLSFIPLLSASPKVAVVTTARLSFVPPSAWELKPEQCARLEALTDSESEALIKQLCRNKQIPNEVIKRICETTQGHPFYLTEFTNAVLQSGYFEEKETAYELIGTLPQQLIPSSLRAPLLASLDRLGPAALVARYASVLGMRFDQDVLAACLPLDAIPVQEGLNALLQADLIRPLSAHTFTFRHALVQGVAYDTMLRNEREAIHARIASCLDEKFPDVSQSQPSLVARHLTASRQWTLAVQRWIQAGLHSLERCAPAETIAATHEGLLILPSLPPTSAPLFELLLLSLQGPALIATLGFSAPSVGKVYARTEVLSQQVGDLAEVFPSLWGNWVFHMVSARLENSLVYAKRMELMGTRLANSSMLVEAYWTQGNSSYWQGNLSTSLAYLDKALELYQLEQHHDNAAHYGQDPGVAAACYRTYVLLALGQPTQAWHSLESAQALAKARQHPFSTSWHMAFEFMYWWFTREPEQALPAAARALTYCTAQDTPFWIASAHIIHGWSTACLGHREAGLEEIRKGMEIYQQTGSVLVQPVWYSVLADIFVQQHDWSKAQAALNEGIQLAQKSGERLSLIDLYTTQGHALAQQQQWDAAWMAFDHAKTNVDACQATWAGLRLERLRLEARQTAGHSIDTTLLTSYLATIPDGHDRLEWQLAQTFIKHQNIENQQVID